MTATTAMGSAISKILPKPQPVRRGHGHGESVLVFVSLDGQIQHGFSLISVGLMQEAGQARPAYHLRIDHDEVHPISGMG
jgi:hypothetical protein